MSETKLHRYRSHTCGALRPADAGNGVRLSGWVHRVRDHGGVLFIDLRDHYGVTQVVADPDSPAFSVAEKVRSEWVIRVDGRVRPRPVIDGRSTDNAELPTGGIEVFATEIEVLSEAKELPLPVFGEPDYPEDIRLTYRFLDLRRETLHRIIMQRLAITRSIRARMHEAGFNEFPTPILTASSPEGARDFLVPSRIHAGKFYALPQAPQQYKQLLMMSGFDRYFQIAPCFRDEDPRADRLPGEFYQLDVEMSFVEQEDVFATMEPIVTAVFEEFAGSAPAASAAHTAAAGGSVAASAAHTAAAGASVAASAAHTAAAGASVAASAAHTAAAGAQKMRVDRNWPRIPYDEAIQKYGSDKPDLRNPIVMADVTEHFRGSGFKVFAGIVEKGGRVWAIPAPKGGSRAFCDRMNKWAIEAHKQPGLGYIMWRAEEGAAGAGPIAKNVGPERGKAIFDQLGLAIGDACFFAAGDPAKFHKFAGEARNEIGRELKLVDEGRFAFAWIVDFPFYEWNEEDKKIDFSHNPFSMPKGGEAALEAAAKAGREALLALKANQYDMVCNGYEIASGSIRNHLPETMVKAFEITGLDRATVEARFGALYRAFQYGAPPHGGMAAGIERMVMLLTGRSAVRDVALFPMNQQAADLLMGAPSEPTAKQLRELNIRVNVPDRKA